MLSYLFLHHKGTSSRRSSHHLVSACEGFTFGHGAIRQIEYTNRQIICKYCIGFTTWTHNYRFVCFKRWSSKRNSLTTYLGMVICTHYLARVYSKLTQATFYKLLRRSEMPFWRPCMSWQILFRGYSICSSRFWVVRKDLLTSSLKHSKAVDKVCWWTSLNLSGFRQETLWLTVLPDTCTSVSET